MKNSILYIPIGVGTFHLESANKLFVESKETLSKIDKDIIFPDEMLLTIPKLNEFLEDKNPSLVIVQNITFANGAYIAEVLRKVSCPVLLWSLSEPAIDGTRLRLNSLTGAFSASNVLNGFNRPFEYVLGNPNDESVIRTIKATIDAVKTICLLKELNILQIGHTPQGFGFGRALDLEMLTTFGANLISIESRELIDLAKTYKEEELVPFLEDANKRITNLDTIDSKNRMDFYRLYKAYFDYTKENNIKALSTRCWPDFFTAFGTPICAVLGILNDLDIASACEADTYGALSMYIASKLSSMPTFFGDPVSLNENENTITFWHCGTAACSLAREDTKACAGTHCNRHIGPTLEFGVKDAKEVTIFRVSKDKDSKFRMFIRTGEALDKPKQFYGTSSVIKLNDNAKETVYNSINNGLEPHFVVAYKNIEKELKIIAKFLKIELV